MVFLGLGALGYPYRLGEAKALVPVPVALIEGTPQAGLGAFRDQGILRLFSLRYEWLLTLKPEEAAEKYGLAARERSHQILYLRPYPYPEDTARLLKRLQEELKASGLPLGAPSPRALAPSPLRYAAWVGVLAGLGLLALGLPVYGPLVAFLLLLFALGYAGSQAGPLLAALVFPVLGFLGPRNGLWMWARSLGYALLGAVFLSALGSTEEALSGLAPFKGVSLTLLVPPSSWPTASWKKTSRRPSPASSSTPSAWGRWPWGACPGAPPPRPPAPRQRRPHRPRAGAQA